MVEEENKTNTENNIGNKTENGSLIFDSSVLSKEYPEPSLEDLISVARFNDSETKQLNAASIVIKDYVSDGQYSNLIKFSEDLFMDSSLRKKAKDNVLPALNNYFNILTEKSDSQSRVDINFRLKVLSKLDDINSEFQTFNRILKDENIDKVIFMDFSKSLIESWSYEGKYSALKNFSDEKSFPKKLKSYATIFINLAAKNYFDNKIFPSFDNISIPTMKDDFIKFLSTDYLSTDLRNACFSEIVNNFNSEGNNSDKYLFRSNFNLFSDLYDLSDSPNIPEKIKDKVENSRKDVSFGAYVLAMKDNDYELMYAIKNSDFVSAEIKSNAEDNYNRVVDSAIAISKFIGGISNPGASAYSFKDNLKHKPYLFSRKQRKKIRKILFSEDVRQFVSYGSFYIK